MIEYIALFLFAIALPIVVVALIVRGVTSMIHHDGNRQAHHVTPLQLKKVACGTAIAALVPGFLYELMEALVGTTSTIDSYGYGGDLYGASDPYATTGVIIGGGIALVLGVVFRQNKVISYGLAAGGLISLVLEFLSNFDAIAAPIRVGAIGMMLIVLIAVAVQKTLHHEQAKSVSGSTSMEGQ